MVPVAFRRTLFMGLGKGLQHPPVFTERRVARLGMGNSAPVQVSTQPLGYSMPSFFSFSPPGVRVAGVAHPFGHCTHSRQPFNPFSSSATSTTTPLSTTASTTTVNAATTIPVISSAVETTDTGTDTTEEGPPGATFLDWAHLTKIELNALVLITSGGGYMLTGGSLFDLYTLIGLLTGTMLCASSAAIVNQLKETAFDANMTRTRHRPLVTGSISKQTGQVAALLCSVGGVGILVSTTTTYLTPLTHRSQLAVHYCSARFSFHLFFSFRVCLCVRQGFACNPITAGLGALTIVMYTHMYTPLKRRTRFNTEMGALVGAVPPVMGWTV